MNKEKGGSWAVKPRQTEWLPGLQRAWCWWGEPARGGLTAKPAGPMTHTQCVRTPPTESYTTEKEDKTGTNGAFI